MTNAPFRKASRRQFAAALAAPPLAALAGCSRLANIASSGSSVPREPNEPSPLLCFQNFDAADFKSVSETSKGLKASKSPELAKQFEEELKTGRARLRLVDAGGSVRIDSDPAYSEPLVKVFELVMLSEGDPERQARIRSVLRDFFAPPHSVRQAPDNQRTVQACFVTGTVLRDCPHLLVSSYQDGLAIGYDRATKLRGYLDPKGQFRIPPRFAGSRDFSEGFAVVSEKTAQWGVIDASGKFVLPPKYQSLSNLCNGWMTFETATRRGIVNIKGEEVGVPATTPVSWLGVNYAIVGGTQQLFGGQMTWPVLITREKQIVQLKGFVRAFRMPVGFAGLKQGEERFRWYDSELKLIYDKPLGDIRVGSGDVAPVSDGEFWGLLGADRKWKVLPRYLDIGGFSYGLASFSAKDGSSGATRNGFLTTDGTELVIPGMLAGDCLGHYLFVSHSSGTPGFYTRTGKLIERLNLLTIG